MIVLPIIRNQGGLKKIQAETTHQNWPKQPRAEMTQAETTQGHNDSGPKQLWAETTRNDVNNNFLPSNRNEARTYSEFKTERFRMMFIVWHSV